MAIQPKNTLKNWFLTSLKPLQQQYHDWMDSYWHKDELIPQEAIDIEFPDYPDPSVITELITLINPVIVEASGPTTVVMPAGKLLQDIVVISDTEQDVSISMTAEDRAIADSETIPAGGWAVYAVSLYSKANTNLYFEGYSNPITIKLYYR